MASRSHIQPLVEKMDVEVSGSQRAIQRHVYPFFGWDGAEWRPVGEWEGKTSSSITNKPVKKFSLMTLNVWFSLAHRQVRNNEIVALLQDHQPTIACFQEVLPDFVKLLKGNEFIRTNYFLSDITGITLKSYGCLMLVENCHRVEGGRATLSQLTTYMDRQLLSATIQVGGGEGGEGGVVVSANTCHFESLSYSTTRETQLREFLQMDRKLQQQQQQPRDLTLLCGDFNFCSYRNFNPEKKTLENDVLGVVLPSFIDLWPHQHGSFPPSLSPPADPTERKKRGYTFDTDINVMLAPKVERMRYDRILAEFEGGGGGKGEEKVLFREIQLVGEKECRGSPGVWPSDHFGLVSEFEVGRESK